MMKFWKTTVVNKHHCSEFDEYMGRGSKWGNPFSYLEDTQAKYKVATREEAIASYEKWFWTQKHLVHALHELRGKKLACFCKPKLCHVDFLARMADSIIHIGFTGHRPDKLGGYNMDKKEYLKMQEHLEIYIERNLEVYHQVIGHSGLALGGDTVWSKAILNMKDKYPNRVLFHAEIPMMEQSSAWFKSSDLEFWEHQVNHADFKSVYGSLADIKNKKQRKKLAAKYLDLRNEGMLDHSDILLALHNGTKGGTDNAVAYANSINLTTYTVHPNVYFNM